MRCFDSLSMVVVILAIALVSAAEESSNSRTSDNPRDGAAMVVIPDGEFPMGSDAAEIDDDFKIIGYPDDWKKHAHDEQPRHLVAVKSFLIYRDEVTNAQYARFCQATGHATPEYWKEGKYPEGKGNHPVVQVSWHDAQAYCQWAGTRLPTEAEWEFAARGGAGENGASRRYPWGDEWNRDIANSASYHAQLEINDAEKWKTWYEADQSDYPLTTPVGQFRKGDSPFGLHDMAGNAWEWTADEYALFEENSSSENRDEGEKSDPPRVTKGGSWANVPFHLRSADRNSVAPGTRNLYIGFRCAKDL